MLTNELSSCRSKNQTYSCAGKITTLRLCTSFFFPAVCLIFGTLKITTLRLCTSNFRLRVTSSDVSMLLTRSVPLPVPGLRDHFAHSHVAKVFCFVVEAKAKGSVEAQCLCQRPPPDSFEAIVLKLDKRERGASLSLLADCIVQTGCRQ